MFKTDFKQRMLSVLELDSDPRHVATGFAVGVFISITPFIGIQTFIAIISSFVFKLNKLTTITGSLINTPLTILPLLMINYRLGEFLLGQRPRDVSFLVFDWHHLKEYAAALFIGTSITGLAAALVSYVLIYRLVLRFQQKDQGLAALSRAAVITGEAIELEDQEKQP